MNFEIVLMPAMIIMGVELRTTWMNNEGMTAIPAFLQQHRNENTIQKIPNKKYPNVAISLYTNYTSDFSLTSGYYSLILGCPVTKIDTVPKGMVVKEIPAAKYAVFTAKGPFAPAIYNTWMEIWQCKDIQRTFTYDFEWYDAKSTDDQNSIVKVYVAIK